MIIIIVILFIIHTKTATVNIYFQQPIINIICSRLQIKQLIIKFYGIIIILLLLYHQSNYLIIDHNIIVNFL